MLLTVSDFSLASDTVKFAHNPLAVSLAGAALPGTSPMPKDALNDIAIRKAKPKAKPYKLADGRGMYLLVGETGKY